MDQLDRALTDRFVLAAPGQEALVDDYMDRCVQSKEPAVVVRLGPPPSLTVHLEPTGKRLSDARREALEQLLRELSSPGAIVLAGPAAGRSDWLRPDLDPRQAAAQVVAFLEQTQSDDLAQPLLSVSPVRRLRPRPRSFNEWLNDTVDSVTATIELLEEMFIRRMP
jgi:hypothetical protein